MQFFTGLSLYLVHIQDSYIFLGFFHLLFMHMGIVIEYLFHIHFESHNTQSLKSKAQTPQWFPLQ
jgi:hypothetical protein